MIKTYIHDAFKKLNFPRNEISIYPKIYITILSHFFFLTSFSFNMHFYLCN